MNCPYYHIRPIPSFGYWIASHMAESILLFKQHFPLCRIMHLIFSTALPSLGPNSLSNFCPISLLLFMAKFLLWRHLLPHFSLSISIWNTPKHFCQYPLHQNWVTNELYFAKSSGQLLLSIVFQLSVMFEFSHSLLPQITPPLFPIQIIIQTFSWSLCSLIVPMVYASLQLEEFHENADYITMLLCSNFPFLHTVKANRLYKAYPLDFGSLTPLWACHPLTFPPLPGQHYPVTASASLLFSQTVMFPTHYLQICSFLFLCNGDFNIYLICFLHFRSLFNRHLFHIHIYKQLNHFPVHLKLKQHCKSTIL